MNKDSLLPARSTFLIVFFRISGNSGDFASKAALKVRRVVLSSDFFIRVTSFFAFDVSTLLDCQT